MDIKRKYPVQNKLFLYPLERYYEIKIYLSYQSKVLSSLFLFLSLLSDFMKIIVSLFLNTYTKFYINYFMSNLYP